MNACDEVSFESQRLLIVGCCFECVSSKVKMLANGDAYVVDDVGNRRRGASGQPEIERDKIERAICERRQQR